MVIDYVKFIENINEFSDWCRDKNYTVESLQDDVSTTILIYKKDTEFELVFSKDVLSIEHLQYNEQEMKNLYKVDLSVPIKVKANSTNENEVNELIENFIRIVGVVIN